MAAPILPNSSNFLGVALVINRSRDGPRFVFHYPPQISPVSTRPPCRGAGSGGDDLDDDDALLDRISRPSVGSVPKGVDLANWNHDDHLETESGSQIVPWEHVGVFPTRDLESILTPARAYHKKLFSVSMDELCAVSYPIYVPENGVWKTKKRQPKSRPSLSTKAGAGEGSGMSGRNGGSPILAANVPSIETHDMAEEAAATPDAADAPDDAAAAEEKKSGMTMFNLVFIINPKKHEAKELVDTLYFHIMRKINKAYKYAQQRSDFVWKESKRILLLKDKGREEKTKLSVLWRQILESSSLAASMQDVYEAVCANRIAALQLETPEGTVTHSVQIPVPFHLADLPTTDDEESEGLKGLWITTANSFADTDSVAAIDDPSFLDKTFALLLLHDEKKIIAELQADPDDTTSSMIEFVRLSKSTTSFYNIGQGPSLSPAQVRKYAQHFIFWRRAIAIPPLHARDVYIMSPNSKTSSLPRASQTWARAFPLAPPLPNFLADLSTAPRPYKWFAPSKIHRPQYLQMLAWLMRGGWVTQLCTFAYVVVWPEIQYEVEHRIEADEIKREAAGSSDISSSPDSNLESDESILKGESDGGSERESPTTGEGTVPSRTGTPANSNDDNPSIMLSPSYTTDPESPNLPFPSVDSSPLNPNESIAEAARLTRLADRRAHLHAERSALHARRPPPVATEHPSLNTAPHLSHLTPYIILDAKKATGKESMYLSAIGARFKDSRVRASWPVFWKYFNGRNALERVALMENMKRKECWGLLGGVGEWLICVRHW
ncbi:nitrogen permease regulator of amino acid transport activity 3-domain-containing protein [Xylariales sp. AK1849]|nr:nitrogen permease regulator of amino acid transport activity 3-domain-containing protein [Xylariales sp. AK1849]